jgi:hypothetical protein
MIHPLKINKSKSNPFRFSIIKSLFSVLACLIFLIPGISLSQQRLNLQNTGSFGDFQKAGSISVDQQGNIYISDITANKIFKYSSDHNLILSVGGYGWDQLTFDQPLDLALSYGLNVYVCDYGNHRIQRFDKNLCYISTYYTRDNESTEMRFGYPSGAAISNKGELFFIDSENNRIIKLNTFFEYNRSFGGFEAGLGRLKRPQKIRIDGDNILYVLDDGRISVFDGFGNYLKNIYIPLADTVKGISFFEEYICILNTKNIELVNKSNDVIDKISLKDIGVIQEKEKITDICIFGKTVYLLTDHKVYILKIV